MNIYATTVSNEFNGMAELCQLVRKAERTGKVVGHVVGDWRHNMRRAANDTLTYDIIPRCLIKINSQKYIFFFHSITPHSYKYYPSIVFLNIIYYMTQKYNSIN